MIPGHAACTERSSARAIGSATFQVTSCFEIGQSYFRKGLLRDEVAYLPSSGGIVSELRMAASQHQHREWNGA
jgi:hypothetical protein